MIRGYVEQPSPRAGCGGLTLRVSTDAPQFRVEVFRHGTAMERCHATGWLPGVCAPHHLPFHDWGTAGTDLAGRPLAPWPAHLIDVPRQWRSGVYIAVLVEGDGHGQDRAQPDRTTPDGRDAKALFVVRPPADAAPAPILYKVPLLTYHAYNVVDGRPWDPERLDGQWCFYNPPSVAELPRAVPPGVSLHRAGGGTGGVPWDITNVDPFDSTPRQTFVHWDARFVAWMEAMGFQADYCTDVDLHAHGERLLAPHRLLVSVGHDEYWSDAMRDAVEAFVAAGGHAAFFTGNTAWWRVVFHDRVTFSRIGLWHEEGRPENSLVGVSFRNGGERDCDDHPVPVGYRVQHADHWVYEGTGLQDGDVLGGREREYLVGYECDGVAFDRASYGNGEVALPSGTDGAPSDFTILGVGDARPSGWGCGNGAATMGVFGRGRGTVFTAATTDWARVLTDVATDGVTTDGVTVTEPVGQAALDGGTPAPADGAASAVARITRNVLGRLSGGC